MLEMDDMDAYAAVTTSGMESIATDSANSASAYATGHKSVVNAMGVYPDNTEDPNDDPRVETIVELAKRTRHMAVGLVTTAEIQDATPAAMFAHTRRRAEYLAIMDQYLHPPQMADVIMGGGSALLLPQSTPGSRRKDNRDLFKEFEAKGYTTATTRTELATAGAPDKLLGLFHLGNMNVYLDKAVFKKADVLKQFTDQPMLWEMTEKALGVLEKNPNGFFLMVEGGLIDKQAHPLDWQRTVWDTIEMDKAVGVTKQWAAAHGDNTLIIVVADHAHSMSITGTYWEGDGKKGREAVRVYSAAQFPDYRDVDGDGFPDKVDVSRPLAIHWANHPDYYENYRVFDEPIAPTVKEGEKWIANAQRAGADELQPGNIPASESNEVHTVEDVPLTASGPGAEQFHRTIDNTEVFFAMVNALGLDARQGQSPFVAER
jgi:alkaline phosphatase